MGSAKARTTSASAPMETRGKTRSSLSWFRTEALALTSVQLREKRANMAISSKWWGQFALNARATLA
jgi:hypothetical protein